MAHFAQVDANNFVRRVVVVNNSEMLDENGVEQEYLGAAFCTSLLGGTWIQTSYNGNFRKNFAGAGFWYDPDRDAFIPSKPYASWLLNDATCTWEPPVPMPDDGEAYVWDEANVSWAVYVEPQVLDTIISGSGNDTMIISLGDDTIIGEDSSYADQATE